jgi:hypothetical protein
MNKAYKVIWSKVRNCYVVVSELAKRNGKSAGRALMATVAAGLVASTLQAMPVFAADNVTYDSADHDVITLDGPVGTGTKITGAAEADITASSSDVVVGSQVYAMQQQFAEFETTLSQNNSTIAQAQTAVNNMKTQVIGINSAVNTLTTQMETGFNVTIGGAKVKTVNPDNNVINFIAGDNVVLANDNGSIKISAAGGSGTSGDTSIFAKKDASNVADYAVQWGEAIGVGTVTEGDNGLVNGDTVYKALSDKADVSALADKADKSALDDKADKSDLDNKADKSDLDNKADKSDLDNKADKSDLDGKADKSDLDSKADKDLGNITSDGVQVIKDAVKDELDTKLDTSVYEEKMSSIDSSISNLNDNKANISLNNLNNNGKSVITNIAQNSFTVSGDGETTGVVVSSDNGKLVYTVNALATGTITEGSTGLVSGDTVYQAIKDLTSGGGGTPDMSSYAKKDASNVADNTAQWGEAIGTGEIAEGNGELVTGGTVYTALDSKADKSDLDGKADKDSVYTKDETDEKLDGKADKTALDSKADKADLDGKADKDSVYTKDETDEKLDGKADKTALDSKADKSDLDGKADKDSVYTKDETDEKLDGKADKTALDSKADKADLDGKADKDSVYTKDETDEKLDGKADKTALDSKADKADLDGKADKDSVYTKDETDGLLADKANKDNIYTKAETDSKLDKKADKTALDEKADKSDLDAKADKDAGNIETAKWAEKLGIGAVEEGDTNLVTGDTVAKAIADVNGTDLIDKTDTTIRIGAKAKYDGLDSVDISDSNGNGRYLRGIITDETDDTSAASVGYVKEVSRGVNAGLQKLDDKINKTGAGAAAMANLHPLMDDGDTRWNVAAGVGTYHGETAAAVGVFYKPSDRAMVNLSTTIGSDTMFGAGVTFAVDKPIANGLSKVQMAKQLNAQASMLEDQRRLIENQQREIQELKAVVAQLVKNAK